MLILINSILYLFGLGKNPLPRRADRLKYKSDFEAISSDWNNVGKDIYKSIQRYEQQEKRH